MPDEIQTPQAVQDATQPAAQAQEPTPVQEPQPQAATESKPPARAKAARVFINPNELIDVKIDVFYDMDTGDFLSATVADAVPGKDEMASVVGCDTYSFKFSRPTYDKLNKYRNACLEYDSASKTKISNAIKLRDYLILFHLREWNLVDGKDVALPLTFAKNGGLSDESLKLVYSVHPSIMDVVMTNYENKAVLS